MRATGPIRVRRDGDDSRVSSYLGLARKILGEVKQRAAAGGLATLYRALTLADGTWIRVGTVHGQDLVEITPPIGGEVLDLETYGFHCRPGDTSGSKTKTNIKRNKKGKWIKQDYATSEWGIVTWWGSGTRKKRNGLQWLGPPERYWSAFGSTSQYIYRKREQYCRSPTGNILGACLYTHSDGTVKVRAATFLGSTIYFYQRNDNKNLTTSTNYPTDPEAWELIGSFAITSLEATANATNTSRHTPCVFWNASGTEAFWIITLGTTTSPTYNSSCECYSVASRATALTRFTVSGLSGPVTQTTQVQPSLTAAVEYATTETETSRNTIECSSGTPPIPYEITITSNYTSQYAAATYSGSTIIAADWVGDDPVYARAEGFGVDSVFTEIRLDRELRCDFGPSLSAARTKKAGVRIGISGTWGDFYYEPTSSFPIIGLSKISGEDYRSCASTGTATGCRLDLVTGCSSFGTDGEGRTSNVRVRFADLRTGTLIVDRSEQARIVSGGQYWVETRLSVELWRSTKTTLYSKVTSTTPVAYSPTIFGGTLCYGNSSSSSSTDIPFSGLSFFSSCCGGFNYIKLNGAAASPEKDVFASVTLSAGGVAASINYLSGGDPETLCGLSTNPKFDIISWVGD